MSGYETTDKDRKAWVVGSEVEVFVRSRNDWFPAVIKEIETDKQGDWITASIQDKILFVLDRFDTQLRRPKTKEEIAKEKEIERQKEKERQEKLEKERLAEEEKRKEEFEKRQSQFKILRQSSTNVHGDDKSSLNVASTGTMSPSPAAPNKGGPPAGVKPGDLPDDFFDDDASDVSSEYYTESDDDSDDSSYDSNESLDSIDDETLNAMKQQVRLCKNSNK